MSTPVARLAVGVDGLPNLVVDSLMQPVVDAPHLRLLCHVDGFDHLLTDLAMHRRDVVLADRSAMPACRASSANSRTAPGSSR